MHIRKELIESIAIEQNYSFLLDLNELMPELLIEICSNLIQKHFILTDKWEGYKFSRHENELLILSKDRFTSPSFFRFAVYFGDEDKMYFGIIGPFDKVIDTKSNEIETIKNIFKDKNMTEWKAYGFKWWYKYFGADRNTLFNSIKNNEDMTFSMTPFMEEFFDTFSNELRTIEDINEELLTYYKKPM